MAPKVVAGPPCCLKYFDKTKYKHLIQLTQICFFPFAVPNRPEGLPRVQYPQKLVLCSGLVKVGSLFIHKECVWHPYLVYVLSSNHQLIQIWPFLKGQSWILPELSKVHVHGKVLKR